LEVGKVIIFDDREGENFVLLSLPVRRGNRDDVHCTSKYTYR